MISRLRRLAGDERGLTLPEVLVATVIFAIVASIATTGLITVMRTQRELDERSRAQAQNRVGMELLTRLLRQATYPQYGDYANSTIVQFAEPTRIVFTGRFGAGTTPQQYLFQVVGTDLRWGTRAPVSCPPTPPAPGTGDPPCSYNLPELTRTAVRGIRNASGGGICTGAPADGAVFTYYEADAINGAPVAITQPVTGDRLTRIESVGMNLFTKQNPNLPRPGCEKLQAQVQIRNLQT